MLVMILVCISLLLLPGCSSDDVFGRKQLTLEDYKKTVASGRDVIPSAVEIEELYGDADHFITHYGRRFGDGPKIWNTEVFFGGRYCLTMQVDVLIDYEQNRIVKMTSEPKFKLGETTRVDILPDGREKAYGGKGIFFSLAEWKQFYKSGGDFSVIGMERNTTKVPNFDRLVESVRRDRVHVSLLDP